MSRAPNFGKRACIPEALLVSSGHDGRYVQYERTVEDLLGEASWRQLPHHLPCAVWCSSWQAQHFLEWLASYPAKIWHLPVAVKQG